MPQPSENKLDVNYNAAFVRVIVSLPTINVYVKCTCLSISSTD